MKRYSGEWQKTFSQRTDNLSRGRLVALLALLLTLSAAIFVAHAYSKRGTSSAAMPEMTAVTATPFEAVNAPAVTPAQGETLQAKLVTLTPRGFDPEELVTSKGLFFLDVENLTGLPEVFLSLETLSKEKIQTRQLPKGKINWAKAFNLPAGTYVLTELRHPEWRCTITVTSK